MFSWSLGVSSIRCRCAGLIRKRVIALRWIDFVNEVEFVVINSHVALVSLSAVMIIVLMLSGVCPVLAQTSRTFAPFENFAIPELNGNIRFAANGSYTAATLENGVWIFENLRLNHSAPLAKLKFSARNSNVTILAFRSSLTAFRGAALNYFVEGQGEQTVNLSLNFTDGEWSVLFNNVFIGEGDGWSKSPDGTLTITGANGNVSLTVLRFADFGGGGGNNADLSFYEQHSVAILTGVVVAIMVVLAAAIWARNRKQLPDMRGAMIA